jgi:heme ABC exporter ATP-binding subunit CcmA
VNLPDESSDSVIQLRDVVVAPAGFPALAGATLEVSAGELVALRGANGAGKTTLLRLCAGLAPLARGAASVLGVDLSRDRAAVRRSVGFVGHRNGLYGELTARENVAFVGALVNATRSEVDAVLEEFGLGGRVADTRAVALSAGQRRRTALASLAVRRARLWLLDEPHSALDADSRQQLERVFVQATAAGVTVVYTTHERSSNSQPMPRTITMDAGRVVQDHA